VAAAAAKRPARILTATGDIMDINHLGPTENGLFISHFQKHGNSHDGEGGSKSGGSGNDGVAHLNMSTSQTHVRRGAARGVEGHGGNTSSPANTHAHTHSAVRTPPHYLDRELRAHRDQHMRCGYMQGSCVEKQGAFAGKLCASAEILSSFVEIQG